MFNVILADSSVVIVSVVLAIILILVAAYLISRIRVVRQTSKY